MLCKLSVNPPPPQAKREKMFIPHDKAYPYLQNFKLKMLISKAYSYIPFSCVLKCAHKKSQNGCEMNFLFLPFPFIIINIFFIYYVFIILYYFITSYFITLLLK